MKKFFTKTQAVAILVQVEAGKSNFDDIDLFMDVSNNKLMKLSTEEVEKKLHKYIDADMIAGVVDDEEVVKRPKP